MKKLFLFAIIIITISFVSCQKQSDISDTVVGNYVVNLSESYIDISTQQTITQDIPSYRISINKQDASTVGINKLIPHSINTNYSCAFFFIGQVSEASIILEQTQSYPCMENVIINREGDNLNFSFEKSVYVPSLFQSVPATYSGIAIKD